MPHIYSADTVPRRVSITADTVPKSKIFSTKAVTKTKGLSR